jgi:hypothetical protein
VMSKSPLTDPGWNDSSNSDYLSLITLSVPLLELLRLQLSLFPLCMSLFDW